MKRFLFTLGLAAILLTGCFGGNTEEAPKSEITKDSALIQKSDFSLTIPNSWQEVHPATVTDPYFTRRNIRALFQKTEKDFRGNQVHLVLTTEKIRNGITALEFSFKSRENMEDTWFGFDIESEEETEISAQETVVLSFSAQKEPDSPRIQYWQTYLVQGGTGYVFTAGKLKPVTKDDTQMILNILGSIRLQQESE
jgi:hypothetical protein